MKNKYMSAELFYMSLDL